MQDGATVQRRADAVFGALLEGSLDIAIEGRYKMEDVQRIHARLEAREQIGKSVMRIGGAPHA